MNAATPRTPPDCLALLSGMLDSALAVRLAQLQGLTVHGVTFRSPLSAPSQAAEQAARRLGIGWSALQADASYAELIRRPQFGRGRALNPCLDCRIYWFRRARQLAAALGAAMVISGEVLGQKPWGQKRRDLDIVAHHSGLEDTLVRPLSAQRLEPTRVEREGRIDRHRLLGICGPSRRPLAELARQWGLADLPRGSAGCVLAETLFAPKVQDLWRYEPSPTLWDYELLRVGRHFRWPPRARLVVGRSHAENERLDDLRRRPDARLNQWVTPQAGPGPGVLVVGPLDDRAVELAARLIQHFRRSPPAEVELQVEPASGQALRCRFAAGALDPGLPAELVRV